MKHEGYCECKLCGCWYSSVEVDSILSENAALKEEVGRLKNPMSDYLRLQQSKIEESNVLQAFGEKHEEQVRELKEDVDGWKDLKNKWEAGYKRLQAEIAEKDAEIERLKDYNNILQRSGCGADILNRLEGNRRMIAEKDAENAALKEEVGKKDAEIERLKNRLNKTKYELHHANKSISGWQKKRKAVDAEIERLEKRVRGDDRTMLQYEDALEEYCAAMRVAQSRAAALKRCAKRWKGYAINHIGLGCVLVRSINNKWWNVEKPSPAWREEAAAYLRGEIKLETPSKHDTPPPGEK